MKDQKEIAPVAEWSPQKKLLIAVGALAAAFLLGYMPSCASARSAERRARELESRAKMSDMLGWLGMTSYEANRNNYANAAEFSSQFFNGLMRLIEETGDEAARKKLQEMLAARDEITANLAQADPTVKPKLAQMYADFYQLTAQKPAS